ncbi:MAG: hypothetical protein WEA61_01780 [Anaerolineales bacterium]
MLQIRKKSILLLVLLGILGGVALAGCSGSALIDINYDATQGVGNIVITGDQDRANQQQDNMSQILLFGLIIALLLGTFAIVISVARRPRRDD